MSRPRRAAEVDPGPVQIQARKVHFDVSDVPLHWISGHPVASNVISLLNLILPAAERWFVATYNEALPLVRDPKLAEDMRGFIGQEGAHAEVHERLLHDFMKQRGVDPTPMVDQMEYVFTKVLAPSTSDDPKKRMNHLCDRLWFIAAIEHYTAVMGDFALNCAWDEHGADPTMADVFRWHGSEEVEHRSVAHDVATYFHDSYVDRIGAMVMAMIGIFSFFQRGASFLMKADPNVHVGWWTVQRLRVHDSKLGLLPKYGKLFGSNTLVYFRPGFTPEQMGSTAQAVAYLARSPSRPRCPRVMSLRQRFGDVPPSLSGRRRHDLFVGLLDGVVNGVWRMTGNIRNVAEPRERNRTVTLTVADRQVVAHDQNVVALTLTAADGSRLEPWHPGSHLDVHLPSGLVRQYSLCGDPGEGLSYRIAVRRILTGGGGSIEVHDALAVGSSVETSGPRNAFPLTVPGFGSPSRQFRFIAGGIGITPILPMLALADRLGVDWSMVYTGRNLDSLPFVDEVGRYGERVEIRTDDANGVPSASDLLGDCVAGTAVYACGPAPLLTAVRSRLAGREDVELHFERFAAPPVVDGTEFAATVASTGRVVRVGAEETLLTALIREDVRAPYSCRQGFCGTCRTRVLSGRVDHRDTLLTDPEREAAMMLICVSRAADDEGLVLDL